ncbi:uncharacterized protein LAJ45_02082 [Morchella importuna]|uniref:uncharacterized protein n=1 Tax=Morchella importuna TaxID=1174673 RepID=UPI001E8E2B6C|nr:uncharacterized protein LAJ45_02082 [Morchella importuna]KAH8154314.1 hypothetical protein LAJ45_02082 [Morchella importuna]
MVFILNIQVVDKRGGQREMREGRERDDKGEVVATGGTPSPLLFCRFVEVFCSKKGGTKRKAQPFLRRPLTGRTARQDFVMYVAAARVRFQLDRHPTHPAYYRGCYHQKKLSANFRLPADGVSRSRAAPRLCAYLLYSPVSPPDVALLPFIGVPRPWLVKLSFFACGNKYSTRGRAKQLVGLKALGV